RLREEQAREKRTEREKRHEACEKTALQGSPSLTHFDEIGERLLPLRTLRRGRRCEGVPDDLQHLLARSLLDRLQAAELEARQLAAPVRSQRNEAEVGEEVRREDRAVRVEPPEARLPLRVAVRERLERSGAALADVADRREEEGLHDPGTRHVGD